MPRNYSRKTDRQSWDKISMKKAFEAVKNNEMGWLMASKVFMVPQSTLRRHAQDTSDIVLVSLLSPVPKGIYVAGQGKMKLRKKQTVLVLTSTPNMEEAKAKSAPPPIPKKIAKKVTKALEFSSDSENDFSSSQAFAEAEDEDEDCPCIYCNDLFSRSKPKEVWLKCLSCKKWAHATCADVPKKTKSFKCELCM